MFLTDNNTQVVISQGQHLPCFLTTSRTLNWCSALQWQNTSSGLQNHLQADSYWVHSTQTPLRGSCNARSLHCCIPTHGHNTAEPETQPEGWEPHLLHACPFPEKPGPGGRSPIAEKAAGTQPLACSPLLLLFLLPGLLAVRQLSHLVVPLRPCGHRVASRLLYPRAHSRAAPRPACAASGPAARPAPRVNVRAWQRAPWRRPPEAGSCGVAGRYFSKARARLCAAKGGRPGATWRAEAGNACNEQRPPEGRLK